MRYAVYMRFGFRLSSPLLRGRVLGFFRSQFREGGRMIIRRQFLAGRLPSDFDR